MQKFASMLICTHLHALHEAAAHIPTRLKFGGDSLKSQHAFQAAYTGSLCDATSILPVQHVISMQAIFNAKYIQCCFM